MRSQPPVTREEVLVDARALEDKVAQLPSNTEDQDRAKRAIARLLGDVYSELICGKEV